jgi:aspartyl/asparaginyl-tRNA synthetase
MQKFNTNKEQTKFRLLANAKSPPICLAPYGCVLLSLLCTVIFKKRFVYVNTPIITGSDAEGAGEMFKVTYHLTEHKNRRKSKLQRRFRQRNEFNGFWTIRGFRNGFSQIYTFGPTFRAENSIHLDTLQNSGWLSQK